MKVTITLGKRAKEYVTGIPENELPEILSDVLERSLSQQVRPLCQPESETIPSQSGSSNNNEDLLGQIRELLSMVGTSNSKVTESKPESKVQKVDSTPVKLDDSDLDMFNFLK